MSISSETSRVSYSGNGVTTAFSFPYPFKLSSDLVVLSVDSTTKVETTKVITTDYTVSGAGTSAGGTVTMLSAPATGTTLVIYRDPPITQSLSLSENEVIPVSSVNDSFDKITQIAQRLDNLSSRSLRAPEGFYGTFDFKLPGTFNATAGAGPVINNTLDGWTMGPTAGDITNAAANATAAAASASAAAASASAASSSASSASSSASSAAASASAAASTLASALWRGVKRKTSADSPYSVTSADNGYLIVVDTSSGAVSITLPQISTITAPFNVGVQLDAGSNAITINRSSTDTIDGATSRTITVQGSGVELLLDATPSPDEWEVIEFGLRGTINSVAAKTSNYTVTSSDDYVSWDATSGAITFSFPAAASNTGKIWTIQKIDSSANGVVLDPNGAETISGASTATLYTQFETISAVSNGSNLVILSRRIPATWTTYTPTFTGWGTVTVQSFYWRRIGQNIEIRGRFTAATTTATEARVSLPYTSSSSINTVDICGTYARGASTVVSGKGGVVLMEPSVAYVTFSTSDVFSNSSVDPLAKANGSTITTTGYIIALQASVPIANWEG